MKVGPLEIHFKVNTKSWPDRYVNIWWKRKTVWSWTSHPEPFRTTPWKVK
jgi:hypothetical protein